MARGTATTITRLYRIHLFSAFVGDLVLPIYYIYLPLLAFRLGASAFEVGLVGGATYAVQSFMPFVMGWLGDRARSRRIFVTIAFLILALASFVYVRIDNPSTLILTRFFEGIGWAMLWPSVESGIVESYPKGRARGLGMYNLVWSGASAIGPLLGAFLVFAATIREAFLVTSVLMFLTFLVNSSSFGWISGKRENITQEITEMTNSETSEVENLEHVQIGVKRKPLPKAFYMFATSVGSLSALVALTFFSPYAETESISAFMIGIITFSYGAARFGTYFLFTKETLRRWILQGKNRNRNIVLALGLASLSGMLFLIREPSGAIYFLAFALVGVGYSLTVTITQVILIAEASLSQTGMGAGMFESSIGTGASIGPIVAGLISGSYLQIAFTLPALAFVGLVISFMFIRRRR